MRLFAVPDTLLSGVLAKRRTRPLPAGRSETDCVIRELSYRLFVRRLQTASEITALNDLRDNRYGTGQP